MFKARKAFLILAAIFVFLTLALPSHAAYTNIYFSHFQNTEWQKKLTGEIYYSIESTSSYCYCVDPSTYMPVPRNYYAESFSIAGSESLLQAAWLMDNYAYSKFDSMSGFTPDQTGTIVQLAIDSVIGQPVSPVTGYETLFAKRDELLALIPTGDLAYLATKYKVLDIYNNSDKTVAYQDVLTPVPSGAPVPLPAAVWLLGSGLVGLAGLRKKIIG
jgi:hypothetical protein